MAARKLVAAGHSVIVLEARDRVGGRTLNHSLGGGKVVEVGGEWVGPTQDHLMALAKELGIGTFKTYNTGNNVYYANGVEHALCRRRPAAARCRPTRPAPPMRAAILQLDQMASTVPVDAPWTACQRGGLGLPDVRDVEAGTTSRLRTARPCSTSADKAVFAAEPRDLSLLFALFYIRAAGNESTLRTSSGCSTPPTALRTPGSSAAPS